jgi:glycosyltransferase involved in cell wall biosynthesis
MQTNNDFEWLIIDDGSTDDTEKKVNTFISQNNNFTITYKRKENAGKHTALNYAHDYINGQLVFMVDDDDQLTADAIQTIIEYWKKYSDRKEIGCLCFQKGYSETENVCNWKMDDEKISNYIDYRIKNNYGGDCAEVVRTDVFKKYPFPVFKDEKFLAEGHLWINMAYAYQTVYITKIIYLCEYLEGGLTKQGKKMRLKNPLGGMYSSSLAFHKEFPVRYRMKKSILYDVYALATDNTANYILKSKNVLMCGLAFPVAVFYYKKWRR